MKKKKTISDQCTVWALCGPEIYEKRKKKNWKNEKGKKKKNENKKTAAGRHTAPNRKKKCSFITRKVFDWKGKFGMHLVKF